MRGAPGGPTTVLVAPLAPVGGFQPGASYSVQPVTTTSQTYALPSGPVAVVYNTGANPITVKLGASGVSVTAGQADVVQPGSWMAFSAGAATYYAVVGNGGSSTVVVSGGSGMPAGAGGGGSGGGGGGTVAQGAQGSAGAAWFDQLVQGGAAVAAGNGLYVQPGTGASFPAAFPANVGPTDCSGATSGTDATATPITAQTGLHGFVIKNIDTTEPLWFSMTGTAAAAGTGSYPLGAATATTYAGGESFTTPPGMGLNHALSVFAHTSGHKYACTWW